MIVWKTFIVTVLVAGIAVAKNSTEAQTARIIAEFQMPKELKDIIKQEVAKECKDSNAKDKTQDAADAVIQFCDCAFRLFTEDSFSYAKLANAVGDEQMAQFWKKNCDKAAQFKKCFAALINGYSPCAKTDFIKSTVILKKDLEAMTDFVCFEDGKRLIPLTNKKAMICFLTKANALRECYKTVEIDASYMNTLRSMASKEMCAKVDEVFTCAANALRTCDTSAPSHFLDAFLKHFEQNSGSCQVDRE